MKKLRKYTICLLLFALLFCVGCAAPAGDGNAAYTVEFIDQNGSGVEGVTLQVCNDSSCMLYSSDEKGLCSFELPAGEYELHILKLPEGYDGNTDEVKTIGKEGGNVNFQLEKK